MKTRPIKWDRMTWAITHLADKKQYEDSLLLLLGAMTGFRIGDLLKFRVIDLTFNNIYELTEQKTGKSRTIPLKKIVEIVKSLGIWDHYGTRKPGSYVFTAKSGPSAGQKLTVNGANVRIKRILKECMIETPKESTHILRKTYARRLFDLLLKKLDDKYMALCIVQKDLNHDSIFTTMTYIGLVDEALEKSYKHFW